MDFAVTVLGVTFSGLFLYYCFFSSFCRAFFSNEDDDDYERDGDQIARIRHGNL